MNLLSDLPNISDNLETKLRLAGICTAEELLSLGSKEAFRKIRGIDSGACLNSLYALEGAIQGIRWHLLPEEKKLELKEFFNSLKRH